MTLLTLLIVGFFVGMKHAVESDHLAAIATLATKRQSLRSNLRQGIAWGVGHTFTLMLLGGAVLALGTRIPASVEHFLESCVGVMLVALGLDVLRRMRREKLHFHVHRHDDGVMHIHAHRHAPDPAARLPHITATSQLPSLDLRSDHGQILHKHDHAHRWPMRAVAIGVMHGMAGSAALVLLSLDAVASVPLALVYILVFGGGSIAGMALLSVAIAVPLRWSSRYLTGVYRGLTVAIAVLTVGLGASVVYSSGIVPTFAG